MIRTVIADDEPLAREGIRSRLESEPDVEIVAEAVDGPDAVETIRTLDPDLVFLDVEMPELDGFQVLERLRGADRPAVVFVTAFDRHAVRAFEAHAIDYLVKPVAPGRFRAALERVRAEINREQDANERRARSLAEAADKPPAAPADEPSGRDTSLVRLTIKDGDRYVLLKVADIDWIESAANYVRIHSRGLSYLLRSTLAELEHRLDRRQFVRIHRTSIVNIDRIREIIPNWHGDFDVVLGTGQTLKLSRGYRDRLLT